MNYLKILKKDKLLFFITSIFVIVVTMYAFPTAIKDIILIFGGHSEDAHGYQINIFEKLFLAIFSIPALYIMWIPKVKEYIGILSDIKKPILVEEKVVALNKPINELFDNYKPGTVDENDYRYVWKVQRAEGKPRKMKVLIFKDVCNLKGKVVGHTYKITYYKRSKVVVKIERVQ